MSKRVQCVPGGHEIELDHAYWCNSCCSYMCYKHLVSSPFTTKLTCKKGHNVSKAK